jgi:hypothetical protein
MNRAPLFSEAQLGSFDRISRLRLIFAAFCAESSEHPAHSGAHDREAPSEERILWGSKYRKVDDMSAVSRESENR